MLEKFKEYKNKLISKFKRKKTSSDALNTLKLWDKELKEYFDIINPKVWFWEVREKLKTIKEKDSDSHKKFILSLWEKDENWKPKYENIIDDVYRRMGNRNKNIDESEKIEAKNLLEEVKLNSMNVFKKLIKELQDEENKDKKISWFRISTLIKILRGDCFCFNTRDNSNPRCIQFDKEYSGRRITKQILQYEGSQEDKKHILISRRHVDKWADLDKMKDCLLKYRKFISYYLTEVKPYVASETWLNDTNFFEYYVGYLKRNKKDPQDQKTIRNLDLTKELSIWDIELLPLTKEWKSYEERRRDFVKDWESSLSKALSEYEKIWDKEKQEYKRLKEGDTLLDLKKLS